MTGRDHSIKFCVLASVPSTETQKLKKNGLVLGRRHPRHGFRAERTGDQLEKQSAASDTELPAGLSRLGATPTVMMGMVPTLVRRWMSARPIAQVYIEPDTPLKLIDQV
jgi:hypothetical protein